MLISISECKFLLRVEGEISRVKVNMSRVAGNKLCLGLILYYYFIFKHFKMVSYYHSLFILIVVYFLINLFLFFFSIWSQDFPSFSNN